jgi:hypothetical protein
MATVVRYPEIRAIHTKLYGVSFENADGSKRQEIIQHCRAGDPLTLVREPANPHDPCAIAVLTGASHAGPGRQLGYIGYHLSRELAAEMDAGRKITAEIVRTTGGGGWLFFRRRHGVNVRLVIS